MDGATFREAVERECTTELDRLGSNRLLVALTDAELTTPSVLSVAAASEAAARGTFAAWADDETDDEVRAAFAATADREREHYERVLESLADVDPDTAAALRGPEAESGDPGPVHGYLRARTGTVERLGAGVVGRGLVSLRTHTQVVSFFINEADERRAGLFRDLRDETETALTEGLDLLAARCADGEAWDRALASATYVVTLAYDDYADALRGMGVDPKPVC